jgi:hypothetical protein
MADVYFGDLHNHCAVGLFHYSKGSLERAVDIAKGHLDFFAFTGHSQWPDMPEMPNDGQLKWQEGFDFHTEHWPRTKELIREANSEGEFVAFLGYEWHTAKYGDRCIIFRDDEGELKFFDTIDQIRAYAKQQDAVLVPHHIAYKSGLPGRGLSWEHYDPEACPVVEIFSEHGGSERDRGPFQYVRHTNGPRTTLNTMQHGLALGHHFGVIAGTDDHFGFPGAYGEGLAAVMAEGLTREAILSAVKQRRCYACTGDRIVMGFRINGEPMGSILPTADEREIRIPVRGWDEIERIDVLRNNRVIRRHFPQDAVTLPEWSKRWLLRVEFGWGPWAALGIPRTADWEVSLRLEGGRLLAYQPCLQSGPFDEDRMHHLGQLREDAFEWKSYTSRAGCFAETPTNALVFELEGPPQAALSLEFEKPAEKRFSYTLGDLAKSSRVEFMAGFPCESFLVHRLVPEELFETGFSFTDKPSGERDEDFYYVRVIQSNGQMAWSSPIWVNAQ